MIFHTVLQSILFITYKVINKVVYIYMSITLRFIYTWLFVTLSVCQLLDYVCYVSNIDQRHKYCSI